MCFMLERNHANLNGSRVWLRANRGRNRERRNITGKWSRGFCLRKYSKRGIGSVGSHLHGGGHASVGAGLLCPKTLPVRDQARACGHTHPQQFTPAELQNSPLNDLKNLRYRRFVNFRLMSKGESRSESCLFDRPVASTAT